MTNAKYEYLIAKIELKMDAEGGLIFFPSHAVEGDTSLENMLAFIEIANSQI